MVNTFVTYRVKGATTSKSPYDKTMKNLDPQRLRKQCVETLQILNILEHLYIIAEHYGWDIPPRTDPKKESNMSPEEVAKLYKQRTAWVKSTRKKYLDGKKRLIFQSGKFKEVPKELFPFRIGRDDRVTENKRSITVWFKSLPKPFKDYMKTNAKKLKEFKDGEFYFTYTNGNIMINSKKNGEKTGSLNFSAGNRMKRIPIVLKNRGDYLFLQKGDIAYTLGFSQHAIIRMWVGYEESLKCYLNDSIDAYCSLETKTGKKCSIDIPKRKIDRKKLLHPWWVVSTNIVIYSHRASLLRKEVERKEPDFYVLRKDFTGLPEEWYKNGYVWTDNMTNKQIVSALKGEYLHPSKISAEINEKAMRGWVSKRVQEAEGLSKKSVSKTVSKKKKKKNVTFNMYTVDSGGYAILEFLK